MRAPSYDEKLQTFEWNVRLGLRNQSGYGSCYFVQELFVPLTAFVETNEAISTKANRNESLNKLIVVALPKERKEQEAKRLG